LPAKEVSLEDQTTGYPSLEIANLIGVPMNKHLNIIIAEDDPFHKKIMLLMLKKLGIKAETSSNGLEVLHILERQFCDIVLMDIQMPKMNGIETTKIIRMLWPHGPKIVVITDCEINAYRKICFDAGANDFLTKPLTIDGLKAAIKRNSPRDFGRNINETVFNCQDSCICSSEKV
jgi:CheY-like chemotaxis protein